MLQSKLSSFSGPNTQFRILFSIDDFQIATLEPLLRISFGQRIDAGLKHDFHT
jgi:hypothetical protein